MNVREIYQGSDGDKTRQLYYVLENRGRRGVIALNLFRAQKCSARAKVYRGGIPGKGSYRDMAYDRKQWSMDMLCSYLRIFAGDLNITWGWKQDPAQTVHSWVLYVEIPGIGQVSFHTASRGVGPDYPGEWDGYHFSAERIIDWVQKILEEESLDDKFRTR